MRVEQFPGVILAAAVVLGCTRDEPHARLDEPRSSPGAPMDPDTARAPDVDAAGGTRTEAEPTTPTVAAFPTDWCARAGSGIAAQTRFFSGIVDDYTLAQEEDCATAGLTSELSDDLYPDWLNYLIGYTNAMVGCPLIDGPVPGGILAFGPANTPALGVVRAPLGRDDAERLIASYLDAFARALLLSDAERAAVESHLWGTAEAEIAAGASRTLWRCDGADAGT